MKTPETISFRLEMPTSVQFGWGIVRTLPERISGWGSNLLIVHGRSFLRSSGLWDTLTNPLESRGCRIIPFSDIPPDPSIDRVEAGIDLCRRERIDLIIGIGGGSVIDVAKAIAGIALSSQSAERHHTGVPTPPEGIPCVAIPTTSGTGAEVTPNAVLTTRDGLEKRSIRGDSLRPKLALVDPSLTLTLGRQETAHSGLDALCQAVESHASLHANPVTQALSLSAAEIAWRSLMPAWDNGQDAEARTGMSLAATLAGIALANARLGAVHGLAHPIGALFGVPHGLICGLLLPPVTQMNLETDAPRYAPLSRCLGLKEATALPQAFSGLLADLRQPSRLRDVGVDRSAFRKIIEDALPSGSLKANPRPMDERQLLAVLETAW